jgi:hypothetical protein
MIAKIRMMIVVVRHERSYVSVPLYTHNGAGLYIKGNKDEYVSVYDSRRTDNTEFAGLSRHAPFVAEMDPWAKQVSELTMARLTYPVSRQYNVAVGIRGRLNKDSTERLIMLYNQYAPRFH